MVPKRKKFWYIFLLKKGQKSPSNLVIARVWGMCTKCTKKFSILVQIGLFLPFFVSSQISLKLYQSREVTIASDGVIFQNRSERVREGVYGAFSEFSQKKEKPGNAHI